MNIVYKSHSQQEQYVLEIDSDSRNTVIFTLDLTKWHLNMDGFVSINTLFEPVEGMTFKEYLIKEFTPDNLIESGFQKTVYNRRAYRLFITELITQQFTNETSYEQVMNYFNKEVFPEFDLDCVKRAVHRCKMITDSKSYYPTPDYTQRVYQACYEIYPYLLNILKEELEA